MQSAPSTVYRQSVDKQRIVIVGKSKARIAEMIAFVLQQNGRTIDVSSSSSEKISDAATIIIEANGDPKAIAEYHHHILIFSALPAAEKDTYMSLADATPKSGGIFFDEADELAKTITKKERPDVTVIPFSTPKNETHGGKTTLVNGSEKIQLQISSADDLKSIGAVKELVTKIGVSSSQFYKAIASFK